VDPNRIKLPAFAFKLISSNYFYYLLAILSIVNFLYFLYQKKLETDSWNEIFLLYLTLILILILHQKTNPVSFKSPKIESKKWSSKFFQIFPIFYVDLAKTVHLNKLERTSVNLSGICFQLIVGLLLIGISLFYYNSVTTTLFNLNFIIVLLNINPFIKFDGYWVLSDLINQKNLDQNSNKIIVNMLRLKRSGMPLLLRLYAVLKIVFYCIAAIYMIYLIVQRYEFVVQNQRLGFIDCFSMVIILFMLFNVGHNLKLQKVGR